MQTLKRSLLLGTALVAAGISCSFEASAQMAVTAASSGTWAANGTGLDDGTIEEAISGATLNITGNAVDITVTNDGVANDGTLFGLPGSFTIGQITDGSAANDGDLIVTSGVGGDVNLVIALGATLDGDVTITNNDAHDASVAMITDSLTVGNDLSITNNEASLVSVVGLTVNGGGINVGGATTVTAGATAGADAQLLVSGATPTFTGGVTLDDGAAGSSLIAFGDSVAQAVTGTIDGDTPGEGSVQILNAAGVTFNDVIGGVNPVKDVSLLGGGNMTTTAALNTAIVNIDTASTLTAGANIVGDIGFIGDGTTTLGNGIDITGGVDNLTGTDGAGTLTSAAAGANTSIITGDVGVTNSLLAVSLLNNGTFQFDGTVAATTITATTLGGTLDFNDDITGNINLADAATIDLTAGGLTVTGNINNTSGADGAGDLLLGVGGGSSITGNIGATNSLNSITLSDTGTDAFGGTVNADDIDFTANGTTATFADDVTASGDIDFNNKTGTATFADGADLTGSIRSTGGTNGTINFSGASTVTGSLGFGAGMGFSALNINGANKTVTITGNSSGADLTTVANSILDLDGNMTLTGTSTNAGTIKVKSGKTLTADTDFAGTGTYNIEVKDADNSGTLNAGDVGMLASAGAIDLAAETVAVTFTGATQAGTITFATGGAAAAAPVAAVSENSLLYGASVVANVNNLDLVITQDAVLSDIATTPNTKSAATALSDPALTGSVDPQMSTFQTDLANAATSQEVNNLISSTLPETNDATRTTINLAMNTMIGITRDHAKQGLVVCCSDVSSSSVSNAGKNSEDDSPDTGVYGRVRVRDVQVGEAKETPGMPASSGPKKNVVIPTDVFASDTSRPKVELSVAPAGSIAARNLKNDSSDDVPAGSTSKDADDASKRDAAKVDAPAGSTAKVSVADAQKQVDAANSALDTAKAKAQELNDTAKKNKQLKNDADAAADEANKEAGKNKEAAKKAQSAAVDADDKAEEDARVLKEAQKEYDEARTKVKSGESKLAEKDAEAAKGEKEYQATAEKAKTAKEAAAELQKEADKLKTASKDARDAANTYKQSLNEDKKDAEAKKTARDDARTEAAASRKTAEEKWEEADKAKDVADASKQKADSAQKKASDATKASSQAEVDSNNADQDVKNKEQELQSAKDQLNKAKAAGGTSNNGANGDGGASTTSFSFKDNTDPEVSKRLGTSASPATLSIKPFADTLIELNEGADTEQPGTDSPITPTTQGQNSGGGNGGATGSGLGGGSNGGQGQGGNGGRGQGGSQGQGGNGGNGDQDQGGADVGSRGGGSVGDDAGGSGDGQGGKDEAEEQRKKKKAKKGSGKGQGGGDSRNGGASLDNGQYTRSGIATGNMAPDLSTWGQFFGSRAEQGLRKGTPGFDSGTFGAVFGIDANNMINNGVAGLTFGVAKSDVDSKGVNRSETLTDTYTLGVYASRTMANGVSLTGTASYGFNTIDASRFNVGGVPGQTAQADYNAHQISADIQASRQYKFNGLDLTPSISGAWSLYHTEGYSETGAGGLNLSSDSENADVFAIGAGLDIGKTYTLDNGAAFRPSLSLGYSYDVIGDQIQSTSGFAAGGPTFTTTGTEPARSTYDAGLSFTYAETDDLEFSLGYGYQGKSGFDSHSGFIKILYRF